MLKAKRVVLFLIAAVALPLLAVGEAAAGGGNFPFYPGDFYTLDTSDGITAVIVLDPNGPVSYGAPATPTGTFGTIAITRRHHGTAAAAFRVQPGSSLGELAFGCNPDLTNPRFVEFGPGQPGIPLGDSFFTNWLPSDVTTKLLDQLGVTQATINPPLGFLFAGIASVISQKCVPFPKKDDTLDFMPFNELLEHRHIRPLPPTYPDLSATSGWVSGFLVLKVNIGLWQ